MWKWIDSVTFTMSRYSLNIPINSITLLSTYESTQSSQRNDSNDSIKSINQLKLFWEFIYFVDLFWRTFKFVDLFWETFYFVDLFWETFDFVDLFGTFWINSIDSIIPVPQSHFFMKTNWLTRQPTQLEKELNRFNQFCGKMHWFKSINSVDWLV